MSMSAFRVLEQFSEFVFSSAGGKEEEMFDELPRLIGCLLHLDDSHRRLFFHEELQLRVCQGSL